MRNACIPPFGQLMPEHGGHFGAILRGTATDGSDDYALIVAPAEAELHDVRWQGKYEAIDGSDSLHDGQANTRAMAAAGLMLALDIQALEAGGHKDWYLPAAAELRALSATVPELFDKDGWYWSSSQCSRSYAWCQAFEYGDSGAISKVAEFRARPVRKVHLHTLST